MTLATYLRHRRLWEAMLVLALVGVGFVANAAVEVADYERGGVPFSPWLPWVLEGTSHVAVLVGFLFILWWDQRFPLRIADGVRGLWVTAIGTLLYAIVHVVLMYVLRQWLFPWLLGYRYHWEHWLAEFGYEYLKDFRTYLMLIGALYLYRFILMRLQGEAGLVSEGDVAGSESPVADRFIVKKLGREFLVRTDDIEWIESAGNYVNLHVDGKVYPLRDTMQRIGQRLEPRGFVRIHRQAIVRLDQVAELQVHDGGDAEVRLTTNARIPVSRRYRQALREQLAG
ncbi:MAG: LytTR family DNA-binding domain-containing protein [Pseudomonadota bacterium]